MLNLFIPTIQKCALEIQNLLIKSSGDYLESRNSCGDIQLKVDVEADKLIEKEFLNLDCVKGICSEEKEEAIYKKEGKYLVAYDPLDGSSLMDSNLSVGSIFGIYKDDFNGKNIVAAGYVVYGPRLEMVFAEKETSHFVYNGKSWQEKSVLVLKEKGKINATGGTQKNWENKHKALIESFFQEGYRLRYSGGMVPDLHQILVKGGGIFSYPSTIDAPKGKLRKLFEVFPFAFIYEKSNGMAIDGRTRLLELEVGHIHDTTPCFFGSRDEITKVRKIYE